VVERQREDQRGRLCVDTIEEQWLVSSDVVRNTHRTRMTRFPCVAESMIGYELNNAYARDQVGSLLVGFRLLEAAGACELIACHPRPAGPQMPEWWSALAAAARGYRGAIFDAARDGYVAIDRWAAADAGLVDGARFTEERARLNLEYEYWLNVVPGGCAYTAWLAGYVATAELDGGRAIDALRNCTSIAADFLDVSTVGFASSVYEQLQLAADALPRFLPLPQHPLRDMRRFAFLPTTFPR
jgi:hypothetical protein